MKAIFLSMLACVFFSTAFAEEPVVNVYAWADDIPGSVIKGFEQATGIKVNYSTYDSNEEMYAKLKVVGRSNYDIIMPTSYYVTRMAKQGMLQQLDKAELPNYKNIAPLFRNNIYDPHNNYSMPFYWGVTGIAINRRYFPKLKLNHWSQLWDKRFHNKLMLLDDARDIFSVALISLGYSPNDENPQHIKQAYQRLVKLLPNIKLYNTDAIKSILVDEDATAAVMWNGDLYSAWLENKNLRFIYPQDGFVIWVDTFAIPKGAPHLNNAYRFINYVLKAKISKDMGLYVGEAIANQAGRKLLPAAVKNNPMVYPSDETLKRGTFQSDVSDQALALYEKYWELLKLQ